MDSSELDYHLPPELIAQHPVEPRDASRLLVYERATGVLRHRGFRDLPDELPADTLAVVNDTRVVPARIPIARPRGEVLLLEREEDGGWLALARLDVERVTLHVGLDTFRPLATATLEEHRLHGERYTVSPAAFRRIRDAGRVLAVGTTTVRVLETLARGATLSGRTDLFVTPG